ncbi:Laccase domain protein YfiH [Thalassocella blandensis]|nr:Laccase domain protein YfiH [Thalassocella blandensis]
MTQSLIFPSVAKPANVKLCFTTRIGGASQGVYKGFNLAAHVNDDPMAVKKNREQLKESIGVDVSWLNQVHGNRLVYRSSGDKAEYRADGAFSREANVVCAVLTADCLPVLLWNAKGTQVAAVHAGWRGLAAGIISQALEKFDANDEVHAYLGPAIGPNKFEVGQDVLMEFLVAQKQRKFVEPVREAFRAIGNNKYLADLYKLARFELHGAGVKFIEGGEYCTYTQDHRFFSYRRHGQCGRMASLIWLSK